MRFVTFAPFLVKEICGFYIGCLLFAASLRCAAASAATRLASVAWSPSAAAASLARRSHHGDVWPAQNSSLSCR
jgi:hypothetical protein